MSTKRLPMHSDFTTPRSPPPFALQERAVQFGLEALTDIEALELLLSKSLPRGAQTWASVLLSRWGSLDRVLSADLRTLEGLIGRTAAIDLKLLHDTSRRILAGSVLRRDVISSWDRLLTYLKVDLAERTREQFRVLFLDKRNRLIADETMGHGTIDHAPVYPREVLRRALELEASAVILVHNHPSGDPTPSSADRAITQEIINAANALRITVHDHVVVAREDVASFKTMGLM